MIGNLGKDPEIRHLESGTAVAKFPVATNENYRDKEGNWQTLTEWHDIVCWRQLAERAEAQLKKGSQVYIEGKLTHRTWQDQEGNNRRTTEVVANYFRALSRREGQGEGFFPDEKDEYPGKGFDNNKSGSSAGEVPVEEGTESSDADDLPF